MVCTCDNKKKEGIKAVVFDKAYFVDEKIGKKMSLTPEGFLLCEDVPIARTGEQIYGPNETPLEVGDEGTVRVDREPEEVFRPETMASFEGKDVVDEHPEEGVTPDNWRDLTVGHVQNVHQGKGVEDDYLFADLIIKDPDAITAVRAGKREVSCGYDAQYEQTGPGRGRQYNIVGNHVALVERGRCGPRCRIKDHNHPSEEENTMAKTKKMTIKDKLMRVLGAKDAAELEERLGEEAPMEDEGEETSASPHHIEIHNHMPGATAPQDAEEGEQPGAAEKAAVEKDKEEEDQEEELPPWFLEHVASNNARFDRLEQMVQKLGSGDAEEEEEEHDAAKEEEEKETDSEEEVEDAGEEKADKVAAGAKGKDKEKEESEDAEGNFEAEAPEGTGDKARKAKDSAYMVDSFQETCALAEILSPGITLPTFDQKAKPGVTFNQICSLRKKALDAAYKDADTKPIIDQVLGGKTLKTKTMPCAAVRTTFRAAGALKKVANAATATDRLSTVGAGGGLGVSKSRKIKSLAELNKLNHERYSEGA